MVQPPDFAKIGDEADKIDVRLSYKIVELFSEGLYTSPNKAIEELVANSFDAGANKVGVFLPPDFSDGTATIAVLDDGEGMDAAGLKQHWLIGTSNKRRLPKSPHGRSQIGKFGIGKLATYVLANSLTHITKKDGKYYSTSMDYRRIDKTSTEGMDSKKPIRIALRELTAQQAKEALAAWTDLPTFEGLDIRLFGKDSAPSWTFAILSSLKDKVHEIRRGTLEWVLRTALPLRDDFAVHLDGTKLLPAKAQKGRLKTWVLGKDLKKLPRPTGDAVEASEDKSLPAASPKRFGLDHKTLGRITGYAECYKELLTGKKSDAIGRSNGFFVYVLGRLINVSDGHFGIKPDELRHGTFGRLRVVVNIDRLDEFLQSDREHVREGPILLDAQNLLRALFNHIRSFLAEHDDDEAPGAKLARKLGDSPASLSRRPIIEMARAALEGKVRSRYIALPLAASKADRDKVVSALEKRAETPGAFVAGIEFVYDATSDDGIAVYDALSGRLRINGFHPFVGAFFDDFTGKTGLPLEMFAIAEVLLEAHLHQNGLAQDQIDAVMNTRDELLRYVAQESGRRTALTIAVALQNARNDEDQLEIEVVAAFSSLGFDATRVGGKGKPDGIATAHLSPSEDKLPRRYAVTLEAKSKKADGGSKTVSTRTVSVSTIVRHRDESKCDHALVVAAAFDHTPGNESALAKDIKADRESTKAQKKPRTITAIHLDDLARLVRLRPVKRLGLAEIRSMFEKCSLPEECKLWIDSVEKRSVKKPPYDKIINAIEELQKDMRNEPVTYAELRNQLKHANIPYPDLEELKNLCKAMSQMAPEAIVASSSTVELDQSASNVLVAIEAATKAHLTGVQ